MAIDPIRLAQPAVSVVKPPTGPEGSPGDAAASFGQFLNQAVSNLNGIQSAANDSIVALASGQPVDVHDVMIKTQQANIAFQLALQVRNKVLDAYQEVTRMQI